MLIDLTPNMVEIERRAEIAKDMNFDYIPQYKDVWKQGIGIYQCMCNFNFCEEEFLEKLNRWGYNKRNPMTGNFEEEYIEPYGVADNINQIKGLYKKQIECPNTKWVISLTPVFQDLENKGKGGGWRWHKWGKYIGELDPKCEYLDDEDFGEDFKHIICFRLYKVEEN